MRQLQRQEEPNRIRTSFFFFLNKNFKLTGAISHPVFQVLYLIEYFVVEIKQKQQTIALSLLFSFYFH